MCAIFGFLADNDQPEEILDNMSSALLQRGPDDSGNYLEGKLGLGHNRLSIIDLSIKGHQPMVLEQDGLVLVFNGEIYNYKELRKDLSNESFFSATDTFKDARSNSFCALVSCLLASSLSAASFCHFAISRFRASV